MSRSNHRKKIFVRTVCFAIAAAVAAAAFFFLSQWERNHSGFPEAISDVDYITVDGQRYERKQNVETFLVLGLDKFADHQTLESYNNDKQADFLLLFVIDHEQKICSALQINRDTMVDVNILGLAGEKVGSVNQQIALAHTYGNGREVSCRNVADALSDFLFGAKIDSYLSITMDAVPLLNDLLGGIEVEVLHDFTGVDDTLVQGEVITLRGEQALHYVRGRQGVDDSSNLSRMVRQQQYMQALFDKMDARVQQDDSFIMDCSLALSEYIVSNQSVTQLQDLADTISAYDSVPAIQLEGDSVYGESFMEFYPDSDFLTRSVLGLFFSPV